MNLFEKLKAILASIRISPDAKQLILRCRKFFGKNKSSKNSKIILVALSRDPTFWVRIFPLARALAQNYQIHLFDFNTTFRTQFTKLETVLNKTEKIKWRRMYADLKAPVVMEWDRPLDARFLLQAQEVIKKFGTSKRSFIDFSQDGVALGDLIYDTYLRFKPAPTVNLEDAFFIKLTAHALQIYDTSKKYLEANPVEGLITAYTAYLHYGIITRLCLKKGIRVLATGGLSPVYSKVPGYFPTHLKDHSVYRGIFRDLNEETKRQGLETAEKTLAMRFQGIIDPAINFMKQSAYSSELKPIDKEWLQKFSEVKKRKVVILLHCFFDSPHIYRNKVFADFYEWLTFLLQHQNDFPGISFYVKPHPNANPANQPVIDSLKAQYPHAQFLPASISNGVFAQAGFDAVLTVYGTVGHEMPYLGVPVIASGDSPHEPYDFCCTVKSSDELLGALKQVENGTFNRSLRKEEIHEFYYMHNLYPWPGRGFSETTRGYMERIGNPLLFAADPFKKIAEESKDDFEDLVLSIVQVGQRVMPELNFSESRLSKK